MKRDINCLGPTGPRKRRPRLAQDMALIALGLALLSGPSRTAIAAETSAENLGRVPEFAVTTLDGRRITRADLAGKVAVINFWATWCPDCMNALPDYIAVHKEFGARDDFLFLAISLDERPADFVATFARRHALTYAIAMGDKALAEKFGGIDEIPTTLILDRAGAIRLRQAGSVGYERLQQIIRSLP